MTPFEREILTLVANNFMVKIDAMEGRKQLGLQIIKNKYTVGTSVDFFSTLDYIASKLEGCRKVWIQDTNERRRQEAEAIIIDGY